jgi:bifunctional oligoribonuclease and PAP phosphatase NrnA
MILRMTTLPLESRNPNTTALSTAFTAIENALTTAQSVMLSAHVGPDGDTLGSMLALKHALAGRFPQLKRVDCLIAGKLPAIYRFMPGMPLVQDVERLSPEQLLRQYDVAICVDCGAIDRMGPNRPHYEAAKTTINIDHHISNVLFGQINLVDVNAAASAEVVADLFAHLGITLTSDMATCLYVGLMTDTGGFKYKNSSPKVFTLAGQLVAAGADPEAIYKAIYDTRTYGQVQLHAHALSNLQWTADKRMAWVLVTRADLQRFGCEDEHLEGLVESIRQIDTVKLAGLFKETRQGTLKVSLRSDDHNLDVAALLSHFGGGGHKMAAGCSIERPFIDAVAMVLPHLQNGVLQSLGN